MGLFDNLRGRRRDRPEPEPVTPQDAPKTCLTGTGRNLDGLDENDQPVKVHLAEPIRKALDELADHYDSNLSMIVRHILFIQLYGLYDLVARTERGKKDFLPYKEPMADMGIMFSRQAPESRGSRQGSLQPDLGKNLDNVKVWLPSRMVADIDQITGQTGKNRSAWIREALIRHLFGRVQLPEKPRG